MDLSPNQSLSVTDTSTLGSYIHTDITENKYVLVRMVDDKKLSHKKSWCEDESPCKILWIDLY